jgi:uncharacterized protein YjbI with pentapeptide repeats
MPRPVRAHTQVQLMANPEHLEKLREGVEAWNSWRIENRDVVPDLGLGLVDTIEHMKRWGVIIDRTVAFNSRTNLNRANLSGANLMEADLSYANLTKANLIHANLNGANLISADLTEGDLKYAELKAADLRGARLRGADLRGANLRGARFEKAKLSGANLSWANLSGANLIHANLNGANLNHANLNEANLGGVDLSGATLRKANLSMADLHAILRYADLTEADLSGANLKESDLTGASLVETDLENADLTGCRIYGISVWNVKLQNTKQTNLVITPYGEPAITVDNLELAQFIYLLLRYEKLRDVLNAVTQRGVLLLGRFKDGGLERLQAIADKLRELNYLPIIFNFDRPESRDYTETVKTLVGLSRFVIVELSGPSVPQELYATVPHFSIPFVPIIEKGTTLSDMLRDLLKYHWFLSPVEFENTENLLELIPAKIIEPAEDKAKARQEQLSNLFNR